MSKVLITGGAGFIGSSLASELATDSQIQITIIDNFSTGKLENIASLLKTSNVTLIDVNINDTEAFTKQTKDLSFDYIFHYAAVVGVQRTLKNPILVLEDIDGIKNILDFALKQKVKRFVYASSSEVYGEPMEIPQREDITPLNSKLPYAVVKNIGEVYIKAYAQEYNLPYTILRFFNTYGPRQSEDFVISSFLKSALKGVDIKINGDGKQTRTFCYIDDNVKFTKLLLDSELGMNDVINLGSDVQITINDLAELIIRLTKSKSKVVHYPPLKAGDMTRRLPDTSKMRSIYPEQLITLEDGLRKMIAYYQNASE